ncbi:response regulator transcription factor [Pleurocapsa sp. FMAR1]|uniref:response regulator transcription factor n=1 Tax=Pleurocapsa sp. FMAR1 TaxID=3040204 RepID=UPI0029C76E58|nr:response regulator transcription factor [Pleurocapsa sp. FMAR1]
MTHKVLIVEDEVEIARLITINLEKEGFDCFHCRDGIAALEAFKQQQPDVIVLDLMMPGLNGLEVCTRIRRQTVGKDPFILMLTAKGEEIDRVVGLSTGADDYLVKPFSAPELIARIRALLRRSLRKIDTEDLQHCTQHFIVNETQRTAFKIDDGKEQQLNLTTIEFDLLNTFASQPNRVWNRTQLIDRLWGDDFYGDDRVVDTHVARLRKKIEPDTAHPQFVKTVLGVGYKFEDEKAK